MGFCLNFVEQQEKCKLKNKKLILVMGPDQKFLI